MAFQIALFISFFFVLSLAKPDQNSSPFDFIKNLQGYEKGSKAPALHDLKLYLARFGYLNIPNYDINSENHDFDEGLEAAVKRYQNFYHLNATGKLDEPTVSQMVMPRCGRPDIRTNQHDTDSFHTVSHYKLFPGLPKWSKTNLTYAFWLEYFPNAYIPSVVRAFNTWSYASSGRFTFTRTTDVGGADLKIRFARGEHGDSQAFDGPSGILAHASLPTDGRLHYDADETWSVGPGPPVPSAIDLETISLHEIGHLLGLDHSKDKNAAMWSYYSGFRTRLTSDDIRGLDVLYGIKNGPEEVSGH